MNNWVWMGPHLFDKVKTKKKRVKGSFRIAKGNFGIYFLFETCSGLPAFKGPKLTIRAD